MSRTSVTAGLQLLSSVCDVEMMLDMLHRACACMNAVYVLYPECAHVSICALQMLHAAYACMSALHMLCMSMCTCICESPSHHRGRPGRL